MTSPAVRRARRPHRPSRPATRALAALALAAPLLVGGCGSTPFDGVTPPLADDSPLARDVGAALAERPELARYRIKVKTLDEEGTVRLSGRVDTDSARATAGRAAAAVPGVRSVINTIYLND